MLKLQQTLVKLVRTIQLTNHPVKQKDSTSKTMESNYPAFGFKVNFKVTPDSSTILDESVTFKSFDSIIEVNASGRNSCPFLSLFDQGW